MAFCGNTKAKLWLTGRIDIFKKIKEALTHTTQQPSHRRIWIHVSSLGEFEQARPLIEAEAHRNGVGRPSEIILSFFSPSGYEIRKNYPYAHAIFYLPLDTPAHAHQFLNLVKPDLAIFVKYEFWLHYLSELKQRQIPTLLISAIFRPKQFAWYNPYAPILKRMLRAFHHIFLQDIASLLLLQRHGFRNTHCVGDTRVDRVVAIAHEAQRFSAIETFVEDAPVFIGGSTWQADEDIINALFNPAHELAQAFKNWKFILAPHEISETNIARLEKLLPPNSFIRYAQLSKMPKVETPIQTLIIDNMGMLAALYRYGRIAYIGGGFGAGIHNTLEPIAFGLPVVFGPKYQKFAEATALIETGGGFSISDKNDFQHVMTNLLLETAYQTAAQAAHKYVQANRGATEKILAYLHH